MATFEDKEVATPAPNYDPGSAPAQPVLAPAATAPPAAPAQTQEKAQAAQASAPAPAAQQPPAAGRTRKARRPARPPQGLAFSLLLVITVLAIPALSFMLHMSSAGPTGLERFVGTTARGQGLLVVCLLIEIALMPYLMSHARVNVARKTVDYWFAPWHKTVGWMPAWLFLLDDLLSKLFGYTWALSARAVRSLLLSATMNVIALAVVLSYLQEQFVWPAQQDVAIVALRVVLAVVMLVFASICSAVLLRVAVVPIFQIISGVHLGDRPYGFLALRDGGSVTLKALLVIDLLVYLPSFIVLVVVHFANPHLPAMLAYFLGVKTALTVLAEFLSLWQDYYNDQLVLDVKYKVANADPRDGGCAREIEFLQALDEIVREVSFLDGDDPRLRTAAKPQA